MDVLALAMGEDLQEDLVEGVEEAKRYALHRVACQVCYSQRGRPAGREGDDGSVPRCSARAARPRPAESSTSVTTMRWSQPTAPWSS